MNKVPKSADSEAFGMIRELRLAGRGPRGRGEAALHFLGSPQAAGLGDGARPGAAPSTPHVPLRPAAPGCHSARPAHSLTGTQRGAAGSWGSRQPVTRVATGNLPGKGGTFARRAPGTLVQTTRPSFGTSNSEAVCDRDGSRSRR